MIGRDHIVELRLSGRFDVFWKIRLSKLEQRPRRMDGQMSIPLRICRLHNSHQDNHDIRDSGG